MLTPSPPPYPTPPRKVLMLGHNDLGDRAVTELASQLSLNKTLVTLDVKGNNTSPRVRRILLRNWHERPSWKKAVRQMVIPL